MNTTIFWVSKMSTIFQFTITLNPMGGISDIHAINAVNGEKVGSLPVPVFGNKFFEGWYTEAVGGIKVTKDTLASGNTRVLYAHWTDPVVIHWNATENGGTLDDENWETTHFYYPGRTFGILPGATGSGNTKDLDGWYLSSDGSTGKITKDSIVPSEETTYYGIFVEYGDSIGRIICPTKNLHFEHLSDNYEWIPDDANRTDGLGYVESQFDSERWRFWNGEQDATPVYTGFKTTVVGPGQLSVDMSYYCENGATVGHVMMIVDRDIEGTDDIDRNGDFIRYATYITNWYGGTAFDWSGDTYAQFLSDYTGYDYSYWESYHVCIAEMEYDSYDTATLHAENIFIPEGEHLIIFCNVSTNYDYGGEATFSNVKWVPSE